MDDEKSLSNTRKKLDNVDTEIIKLLGERRKLSVEAQELRQTNGAGIRDFDRERTLIMDRIQQGKNHGLDENLVTRVFHEVIEDSVKKHKLASREHKRENTVIDVGGVRIGDGNFLVIAGPCSVESREQIISCAREAKTHGAQILRGGVFKPRTSPYSFQGLGYPGLDLLMEAGRLMGMPVITEVMTTNEVERVAAKADILQIGARNMQNFSLLKAVGEVRRPVMLKRGMSSSIEELLQAVEYILAGGNEQVFLCERGIRTFETVTRATLDISAVPVLKVQNSRIVLPSPISKRVGSPAYFLSCGCAPNEAN